MGDSQPRRLEERIAGEIGLIAFMLAMALLQVTLLQLPLGFPIPLVLVLVVCRTLLGMNALDPDVGVSNALRWAIYGGLTLDVLATTYFGSHVLALLMVVFFLTIVTRRLRIERIILPLLAMLVSAIIYESILALLTQPQPLDWAAYTRVVLLPVMLIALIPTLPVFFVMRWALRRQL